MAPPRSALALPPRSALALSLCGVSVLYLLNQLMASSTATSRQIAPSITTSAAPTNKDHPQLFMRQSDPLPPRTDGALRLVFLSDTHGRHDEIQLPLPDGDVLFHLGDVCNRGNVTQMRAFMQWIKRNSSHKEIVAIDGNHDRDLGRDVDLMAEYEGVARVLRNEVVAIAGGKLTVAALTWDACRNEDFSALKKSRQSWNESASEDQQKIDLLLSHFPPYVTNGGRGWHGSVELSHFAAEINPPLHCFGHIHYARGVRAFTADTTSVNCASTSGWYPVTIDYCPQRRRVLAIHCPVPALSLEANLASSKFPKDWVVSDPEWQHS